MGSAAYWLALKAVPGIGNRLYRRLIDRFGDPENVFSTPKNRLMEVEGVSGRLASAISQFRIPHEVYEDLAYVRKRGFKIITFNDPEYPSYLRQIHDPPPFLYVYGNLQGDNLNIAVVGSRIPTPYGLSITYDLCEDLVCLGFTVVSGFARGIDTAAHEGALAGHGRTIAVLGCGLGITYPAENEKLLHRIAQNGAVISEFKVHEPPEAHNFPIRNRIISGMSLGTVIVEATKRSGSLITARLALEQGREVFAVPGSVKSFKSMGTHQLIKEGAKLVENVQDIIEELNIDSLSGSNLQHDKKDALGSFEEQMVLDALNAYPVHIDELVRKLSLDAGKLSSILLQLEMKGLITQTPGKFFARCEE